MELPFAPFLLKKLDTFELEKGYLRPDIKLGELSKIFKTNSSYLSKTINLYKGKNFNQYLNDLRINYAISKLDQDKIFRKYTIKAMAEEVGFKNPDSFVDAFINKTGEQPNCFIKKYACLLLLFAGIM